MRLYFKSTKIGYQKLKQQNQNKTKINEHLQECGETITLEFC